MEKEKRLQRHPAGGGEAEGRREGAREPNEGVSRPRGVWAESGVPAGPGRDFPV